MSAPKPANFANYWQIYFNNFLHITLYTGKLVRDVVKDDLEDIDEETGIDKYSSYTSKPEISLSAKISKKGSIRVNIELVLKNLSAQFKHGFIKFRMEIVEQAYDDEWQFLECVKETEK